MFFLLWVASFMQALDAVQANMNLAPVAFAKTALGGSTSRIQVIQVPVVIHAQVVSMLPLLARLPVLRVLQV